MAETPCERQINRLLEALDQMGYTEANPKNCVELTVKELRQLRAYRKYVRVLIERKRVFGVLLGGLVTGLKATFLDVDLERFERELEDVREM